MYSQFLIKFITCINIHIYSSFKSIQIWLPRTFLRCSVTLPLCSCQLLFYWNQQVTWIQICEQAQTDKFLTQICPCSRCLYARRRSGIFLNCLWTETIRICYSHATDLSPSSRNLPVFTTTPCDPLVFLLGVLGFWNIRYLHDAVLFHMEMFHSILNRSDLVINIYKLY